MLFGLTKSLFLSCSGRYSDFAKQLNKNGYKVYGMDWIGKMETTLHAGVGFRFISINLS